jgi:hypothetical protein
MTKPTEYVAYPDGYVMPVKPTEYIAYPEGYVPAKPAAPRPAAAAAPAVKTSGSEGLLQVETDPGKVAMVGSASAAHSQPSASRRRARQHEVYVENEPLVQVETHLPKQ